MIRKPRPALVQRQQDVDRVNDMTVKVTHHQVRLFVVSPGEHSLDILFPVRFCERPFFTYGLEFADNAWPTAFAYPMHSATAGNWRIEGALDGAHEGYFLGCTVALKVLSPEGSRFWLDCTFSGKAIRNPLLGIDEVGATI